MKISPFFLRPGRTFFSEWYSQQGYHRIFRPEGGAYDGRLAVLSGLFGGGLHQPAADVPEHGAN